MSNTTDFFHLGIASGTDLSFMEEIEAAYTLQDDLKSWKEIKVGQEIGEFHYIKTLHTFKGGESLTHNGFRFNVVVGLANKFGKNEHQSGSNFSYHGWKN